MKPNIKFVLALLLFFLIGGHVHAQPLDARSALKDQPILCTAEDDLRLVLPENMSRVDVYIEGVLCAFRNKIGGFPTINVIKQPRQAPSRPPTLKERSAELLRSYGLVGLTDATVEEASENTLHGVPAYSAKVRYTNKNIAMNTLVLIVELPDRSYTVSALDTAEGFKTSENALREILKTVTVEGADVVADTKSTKTSGIGTILFGILLALGITVGYRRMREARR